MRRFLVTFVALSACVEARAQQPSLSDVLARLDSYLLQYEATLASVVAEERYTQTVSLVPSAGPPVVREHRVLRSDYALARAPGGEAWSGFRDTFDVDGRPVRDREDRLAALLTAGAAEQAMRISRENARYNLSGRIATRTINVPTIALDLIHPRHRSRFSFRGRSDDAVEGAALWRLDFEERRRPTMIRTPEGRDQKASGSVWVDPNTGEVVRTLLRWERGPRGFISVDYRREPTLDALVPFRMVEQYLGDGNRVDGEAIYTNYRRFETSARILP